MDEYKKLFLEKIKTKLISDFTAWNISLIFLYWILQLFKLTSSSQNYKNFQQQPSETNITQIIFKMAQFKILFIIAALFLVSAFSLSPCAQKGYVEKANCMEGAVDPSGGNCWWAAVISFYDEIF